MRRIRSPLVAGACSLLGLAACAPAHKPLVPVYPEPRPRVHPELDRCADSLLQAPRDERFHEERAARVIVAAPLGLKRISVQLGEWTLLLDYGDFVAVLEKRYGRDSNARVAHFFKELDQAVLQRDVMKIEPEWVTYALPWQVGELLDRGRFALAHLTRNAPPQMLVRFDYTLVCGPECGGGGHAYATPNCVPLLEMDDWVS